MILTRTPYPDPTFPWSRRPITTFVEAGYAFASQACRGTWKSTGQAAFFHNEPEDGYDAIEWLATQDWCNGKVGMVGRPTAARCSGWRPSCGHRT